MDRVKVSRGRVPAVTSVAPGVLQRCGSTPCRSGECDRDHEGSLGRRSARSTTGAVPPIVGDVLASPGHDLGTPVREQMEWRFGADFSRVRVHTDDRAAASAVAVGASAYTVGRHIVFGAGRFAPMTKEGRRLLGHELVHTLQQRGAEGSHPRFILQPGHPSEVEADARAMGGPDPRPGPPASAAASMEVAGGERVGPGHHFSRCSVLPALPVRLADGLIVPQGERQGMVRSKPQEPPRLVAPEVAMTIRARCDKRCAGLMGGKSYGETECDIDKHGNPTGTVLVTVTDTDPCTRPCVETHEANHARLMSSTCSELHACLTRAAAGSAAWDKCWETFQRRSETSAPGLECGAYRAEAECMHRRKSESSCRSREAQARLAGRLRAVECYRDCFCTGVATGGAPPPRR